MNRPAHPIRVGLKLARGAPIEAYRDVWRIADQAGFDHVWAFDHLALDGPAGPDSVVFEGWSLLAAMAVATARVRIGLLVSGLAYRHPAVLAKQAATVDHLSGGRLEFGIGAGWAAFEHRTLGVGTTDHPAGRLSEGLEVIQRLWSDDGVDFEGRHFELHGATLAPRPVQRPRPPIWIGAGGPRVLGVAARHADVWLPAGEGGPPDAAATGARLDELCRESGRDPHDIRWCAQIPIGAADVASALEDVRAWHDAGFTELVLYLSGADAARDADVAAERLLPEIRSLATPAD